MTPRSIASALAESAPLSPRATVLEPSFGDGAFLMAIVERLVAFRGGGRTSFETVLAEQLYGVEIDPALHRRAIASLEARWGPLPASHNLYCGDYFTWEPPLMHSGFDLIIGNPPFGGSFDPRVEDSLDRRFGFYRGHKLKKETYSFFVAKALSELAPDGHLRFVCSDTFLTIKTMRGLREALLDAGRVTISELPGTFDETAQPMVVLDLEAGPRSSAATIRGRQLAREVMERTANLSWGLTPEFEHYFHGPTLSEYVVATGGMTIGKNAWFVRAIENGQVEEPYEFEFFDRPITLEGELARARLNRLSPALQQRARRQEADGATRRAVRVRQLETPRLVTLPHASYRLYNKATSQRLYAPPTHAIYWADDGDAVLTFKKDGPWYLHGVGGQPYFGREGITWQLVAARLNARYLPDGYILDSGAPCAFLRDGVHASELYFILGWLLSDLATVLLKTVINHTRNIQGKDIERLPYPHWLSASRRAEIAARVRQAVAAAMAGHMPSTEFFNWIDDAFAAGDYAIAA
jgi:hypothetical protein